MKQIHNHPYTLLEVLVAVAVLLIMMGFLFQFAGGAQKLWASSTARSEMSAKADAIFNLIGEDLENMYVVSAEEDLDAQAAWYCAHVNPSGTNSKVFSTSSEYNLDNFCFFTQATDGAEDANRSLIYGVRYHFEPKDSTDEDSTGRLYRYEASNGKSWQKLVDIAHPDCPLAEKNEDYNPDPTQSNSNTHNRPWNDPQWYCNVTHGSANCDLASTDDEEYLVADNIQSIQIFSDAAWVKDDGSGSDSIPVRSNPILEKPSVVRVTVTFEIPKTLKAGMNSSGVNTDRTFSRVYRLVK